MECLQAASLFPLGFRRPWQSRSRARITAPRALAVESRPDFFLLELAEKLEDSVSKGAGEERRSNLVLKALRDGSAEVAVTCKWPSSKDEAYRFTNVKFLKDSEIQPLILGEDEVESLSFEGMEDEEDESIRLVFVDGILSPELSKVEGVPPEVYVGSILGAPDEKLQKYVVPRIAQASTLIDKDAFVSLNGIGALDLGVVLVPKDLKLEKPIHVVYYSTPRKNLKNQLEPQVVSMTNPRLLVVASEGATVHLVEEFRGGTEESSHWTNSVCEIVIESGASVSHDLIQTQERSSVSMKKTYVSQEKASSYKCVDVELGSKLSRHNLHIEQLGSDTKTDMLTFLLCGRDQVQDLHSRLILNHPRGYARQLQKCIVMNSTGHGVFDGNIRVNRDAQQTDAGQLSRSLLLAPRATVNAKPSLQINADDVKCTHGVAISDLDEDQLFYFRARGIDAQTARSALVFSFGAEVIEKLESKTMQKSVEELLKSLLLREGAI
ncbi:protein ABCI7, chloroplastic [Selaginella moellendorffii]|nr:protein ABCI7, chloroplastic [Selaginella moellendorffii]|eukprot:XP_002966787.2 protein ABCI7, chloroplastic [Selaginella moellendorffii]